MPPSDDWAQNKPISQVYVDFQADTNGAIFSRSGLGLGFSYRNKYVYEGDNNPCRHVTN